MGDVSPIEVAAVLRARVDGWESRLRELSGSDASRARGPGKWTRREILGHLIDSAANNHQRFVRLALLRSGDQLRFPAYEQERWVRAQRYSVADWVTLVALWCAYNRHIAWVVEGLPADARGNVCRVGESEPVTLGWLVEDYLRHLDHHLAQLEL